MPSAESLKITGPVKQQDKGPLLGMFAGRKKVHNVKAPKRSKPAGCFGGKIVVMDHPRFTIFTATNTPRWLLTCYESICNQTFTDWEWVIGLNGPVYLSEIPSEIVRDKRVRCFEQPAELKGIGAWKRHACEQARGEIFVELDHDDYLTPDCLAEIQAAAIKTPRAFYFSDVVYETPDGKPWTWSKEFGWDHETVNIMGRDRLVTKMHDVTAASLMGIWWVPDHVRAWSREAYLLTGGHDPAFPVCDDYSLVVRTFLAKVPMVHIKKPLYLYRWNDGSRGGGTGGGASNTAATTYQQVQQLSYKIRNDNCYNIVLEWTRRQGLRAFDLGGAHANDKRFEPVDIVGGPGIIQADIAKDGLPFSDNSAGCIRAWDFLEHIPPYRVPFVMNEIYRVLAPGGYLLSLTPSTDAPDGGVGRGAFQDPSHVSFWNCNSFWYYTQQSHSQYVPEFKGRFQALRNYLYWPNDQCKANRISYVVADLCALKGQRQPGQCLI